MSRDEWTRRVVDDRNRAGTVIRSSAEASLAWEAFNAGVSTGRDRQHNGMIDVAFVRWWESQPIRSPEGTEGDPMRRPDGYFNLKGTFAGGSQPAIAKCFCAWTTPVDHDGIRHEPGCALGNRPEGTEPEKEWVCGLCGNHPAVGSVCDLVDGHPRCRKCRMGIVRLVSPTPTVTLPAPREAPASTPDERERLAKICDEMAGSFRWGESIDSDRTDMRTIARIIRGPPREQETK